MKKNVSKNPQIKSQNKNDQTRSFAHTMSRPHDAFAMSRPWRPSLPKGVAGWNVA